MPARARAPGPGAAPDEALSNDDDRREVRGHPPRAGLSACPEHVVKTDMFRVLDGEDIGMMLTDSYAMYPASSVSGFYFSHPQSQYFNVGVIGEDQLEDYARRSAAASRTCAARWRRTWAERLPGTRRQDRHVPRAGREDIGMMLTDSYAMYPASSVSGFYFSHPQSQYFNVGVIGEDQLEDYAPQRPQHRGPAPHAGAEPG